MSGGTATCDAHPASNAMKTATTAGVMRRSATLAHPHAELDLHVGTDDVRDCPLASTDAEGAALDNELALQPCSIAGLVPAEWNLDRLLHALDFQHTVRQIV